MLIFTALSGNNLDRKDRPSLSVFTTVGGMLSCRIMLCDFTESKGITMGVRNVVTSEG